MAAALRLTSRYEPDGEGSITVALTAAGTALAPGFRLALTSQVQLTPPPGASARLVDVLASYHELAPDPPLGMPDGGVWRVAGLRISHRPRHANDGPVSAFVITHDGAVADVAVEPMRRAGTTVTPAPAPVAVTREAGEHPALVPYPARLTLHPAGERGGGAGPVRRQMTGHLATGPAPARVAWDAAAALGERLGVAPVLVAGGELPVDAAIGAGHGAEGYLLRAGPDGARVEASTAAGFRHGFTTLAQWLLDGAARGIDVADRPALQWRGLHVDLARQWFEPSDVARILDLAAWRKLDRVHLHLTDDEAWRLPVAGFPQLTEIGGRRGHGRPIPPMLGDGAHPPGRGYTPDEIGAWVRQADALGVVLVPEFDVPGHAHAALTALPGLRDPDDSSRARSVQYFTDNVLVPGLDATTELLVAVVDAVAALFPSSPWIHIGGDEVPHGAWRGSPVVAGLMRARSLASTRDVEAAFHRDLVATIRTRTGRAVGAWQEAAESGGVHPGDGYVVGWTSAEAGRRLAAAGHDVVLSPGEAYYLDIAPDDGWDTPGAGWAGTTSLADVCAFEPGAGWDADARRRLLGVQACVWTEHIRDHATFDRLVFPRLDAIAERAWTGAVAGGAASLAARAAAMPALTRRR